MNKNHKRISAAVLSLALGFSIAGAPILAPVAGAQASIVTPDNVSTVDLDAKVSLTINKYSGDPTPSPLPDNAMEGVKFTVQKIELGAFGLDTMTGWNAVVTAQTALEDGTTLNLGTQWTLETDTNGTASISTDADSAFTVGAYLVTEEEVDGYTVAKPFIVTLPFTDGSVGSDGWGYERIVSPKNQKVSLEKTVEDKTVVIGSDIDYTISATIPAEAMTSLSIKDALPAELGRASDVVVRTAGATLPANNIRLNPVADYSEITDGPSAAAADNDLTIELTADGLLKINALRANNPDLTLIVEFSAAVIALPGNGVIRNDAIVNYPNSTVGTAPTDPDDPIDDTGAQTRLGTLQINKVASNDQLITEGTATFQLWRCIQNANDRWEVSGTGPIPVHTKALSPAPTTEAELADYLATPGNAALNNFTTVGGQATLYGIRAFNYADGKDTSTATPSVTSDICLVETVAPDGYSLNPDPQPVNTYTNVDNPAADDYAMTSRITNINEDALGQLPATGGQGTLAMIAAGLLVAVAGGFAALRGNRARK